MLFPLASMFLIVPTLSADASVDEAHALASAEAVEAFAMFVREGSFPVWRVSNRKATLMHSGQRTQNW